MRVLFVFVNFTHIVCVLQQRLNRKVEYFKDLKFETIT